jgi:hypothetical protein
MSRVETKGRRKELIAHREVIKRSHLVTRHTKHYSGGMKSLNQTKFSPQLFPLWNVLACINHQSNSIFILHAIFFLWDWDLNSGLHTAKQALYCLS